MKPAPPLIDPQRMMPFVDRLPLPEIATPLGKRLSPTRKAHVPFYRIPIHEFFSKIHRDVPPTRFWGYANSMPGPTIEARSGEEILIEWPNQLPAKHFLPIDHTIMGAEKGLPDSRTVVHVHGGRVPPESDGWPEGWYAPGKSATYHYPNQQDAALLWYHDHAMGINRLNICAGMAGLYVIRDSFEDALNLPKGEHEIPLVLMDRMIGTDGQIYYPVSQFPDAPWIPEYSGNATLINGKLLPYLDVQPRKYRVRILNAANSRFYFLSLGNNRPFQQIGSDQGLLSAPVAVSRLAMAPGERADVVVDFAENRGQRILLNNLSAPLMQFRVGSESVADPSAVPPVLRPVPRMAARDAIRTRQLTLQEVDNVLGDPLVHLLDDKHWHDPVSEKPVLGETEIWELLNLTDDAHPIHLHLVRFQILDRRPIDIDARVYDKKVVYIGEAVEPDANEAGWKDTVRCTPGASTRIIVKFDGYIGRYVWHCHILEHEDNEMMRPYEVVAPARG
ncbi:MAG TPA: multicopper oxidase domain-containing protein [Bryobacteraceae bacterium]|nr:multicopper oxidase domain-containing protein [Bryobacteraceae bacterium]